MENNENVLTKGFTNSEWENFAKHELLIFMEQHGIEKATIDDGCGRKARLAKDASGNWKSNVTLSETF
jgi:hypothetical protein